MKASRIVVLALIAALALTGCAGPAEPSTGAPEPGTGTKVIKIGFAAPLTGDNALYGQGMKRATELAIAEANESQAAKDAGITFEIKAEDDAGDPKQAVNAANALVGDTGVVAVVGHFNSGCTIPAAPVYERAEMAFVTVSTNPQITAQGHKSANRVVARDDAQGAFAGPLAKKLGYMEVALVDDSTPYGQGLAAEFLKVFTEEGGTILMKEQVPAKTVDFASLITKIKARTPQAVYYAGAHTEGALLAKQMAEAGLNVPILGGDMLFSPDYISLAGQGNTEGHVATSLGEPLDQQPQGSEFHARYVAKYNQEPESYDSYAYDAANAIIAAILDVDTVDRVTVRDAVRNGSIEGVAGTIAFDENGDNKVQVISAYSVIGGEWTPLP